MSQNIFNSVELIKPKSNVFDLTHDVKLSGKMGDLIPVMVAECIPGDKFTIGAESLIRFAPMIAPVMHRIDVSIHYFFVPNRILWENWEKWIVDSQQTTIEAPWISISQFDFTDAEKKFLDYMGVPPLEVAAGYYNISALPFAAYQAIYHEYYRDQNLVPEFNYKLVDGQQALTADLVKLRKRAWEHDYFTASLPFAQKGAVVDIPLGEVQLVEPNAIGQYPQGIHRSTTAANPTPVGAVENNALGEFIGATTTVYDPNGSLQVESTTITDLRRAFKLQEWLEKNARAGTRYIENILAHFGVRSSDKRLQRPEYITGIKSPVVISEIVNTTGQVTAPGDDPGLPQGNMAGHGISVSGGRYGSYFCEEHGFIIGIMSVMPKTAYQQGIPKFYDKWRTPLDYYWPSFAHIGEQAVLNQEIYVDDIPQSTGQETFGYVPRYAEYKFIPNRVAGDFRTTLNYWHLGRVFDSAPALNQAFIECTPSTRIFAVEDGTDYLWCHVLNKVKAIRPMPKFGNPYM